MADAEQQQDSELEESALQTRRSQAVVERMYMLVQLLRTHGENHPLTKESAETLRDILVDAGLPFSLQFIGQAVFRDRNLVPFGIQGFHRVQEIRQAMENLSVHEIAFMAAPEDKELQKLGMALARGMAGESRALKRLKLENISWRELPGAKMGLEMEKVDPEVFVATQITLAISNAEELAAKTGEPWNGGLGLAVVRRLQRCQQVGAVAAHRALEIAPGEWTIARRAV